MLLERIHLSTGGFSVRISRKKGRLMNKNYDRIQDSFNLGRSEDETLVGRIETKLQCYWKLNLMTKLQF